MRVVLWQGFITLSSFAASIKGDSYLILAGLMICTSMA